MLAFFCLGARYRPWRYSAAVRSRVFGDGAAPRRTPAARPSRARTLSFVLLMGRRSPSPAFGAVFMRGGRQLFGAGRIQASVHGKIFANAFSGDWQWQYSCAVRSRASIRGKIPPRCVLGRQSVASFALHASRKRPRTGKSPVRGKIRTPCIRNELALARYARHASEKPCKQLFGNTPREDLARKGRLSLHGPLESCTARRSCHPSWRQTARAPATPVPPNSVSRQS